MKKSILLIFVSIFCLCSSAQLTKQQTPKMVTVGEVKSMRQFVAELTYTVFESDTTYTLFFRNNEYQALTDIQFIKFDSDGGTVNQLYELLSGILTDPAKEHGYKETVTLGITTIIITKYKALGNYYISIFSNKGSFAINKKQVDKLFGKG